MMEIHFPLRVFDRAMNSTIRRDPLVRRSAKLLLDTMAACLALFLSALLLRQPVPQPVALASFLTLAMIVNIGFRLHSQHYRVLGIEEAESLLLGDLILATGTVVVCQLRQAGWPGGGSQAVVLSASLLTGQIWLSLRLACVALFKWQHKSVLETRENATGERTLIIGAGRAGILLCRALRDHSRHRCTVVGFIDDALEKQGVRIHGVPVLGPTDLLACYIREQKATQVIFGMAGVSGARLRQLAQMARQEGVQVKTVPGILDLVGDRPWKPEVRDLAIEDLLRREPIVLDTAAIRTAVEGGVVLITGGGGSIGSELARRVAALRPERLVLLGRGENSLWLVQRELAVLFPGQQVDIALCDIRNPARVEQVFKAHLPEIVLHAAAHKHVPFLENCPEEAIENNIFGTRNVLDAALEWGTRTFVNVSTDKAVNPVNVLGVSKRIGEIIIANEAASVGAGVRLISVRFGNVLGSRGSVIPVFKEQILRGGPVTVTHPGMVRYFMTIPEAAQLVLQAGLFGDNGKVFALDMGVPMRIVELAQEMIRLSGYSLGVDMDIRFTGARPGEKLCEELFTSGEERQSQVHVKVFEADQDSWNPQQLARGLRTLQTIITYPGRGRHREILDCLMQLVPSYRPSPSGLGRYLPVESGGERLGFPGAPAKAQEPDSSDFSAIA